MTLLFVSTFTAHGSEGSTVGYADDRSLIAHVRIPIATRFSSPENRERSPIAQIVRDHRFDLTEAGAFYVRFHPAWLRKHQAGLPERLHRVHFKVQPDLSSPGTDYVVPRVGTKLTLQTEESALIVNNVKYARREGYLTRREITRLRFEGDRQVIALLPWAASNYNNLLTVVQELTAEQPSLYIGPASSKSLHHLPLDGVLLDSVYGNDAFTFSVGGDEHILHRRGDIWVLDGGLIVPLDPNPYFFLIGQDESLFIL